MKIHLKLVKRLVLISALVMSVTGCASIFAKIPKSPDADLCDLFVIVDVTETELNMLTEDTLLKLENNNIAKDEVCSG